MTHLLLGPILRYQDSSSATIWVEVSAPAMVEVLGTATTTFAVCDRHYAFVIIEGLEPDTVYEYEVRIDRHAVWPEPGSTRPPSVIRTEPLSAPDGPGRARIPTPAGARAGVPVWQVVSSPIRNALIPPERGVMRFTLTRAGRVVGACLRRLVRSPDTRPRVEMKTGPLFANNLGVIEYGPDEVWLSVEHDVPDDEGEPKLADIPSVRLV